MYIIAIKTINILIVSILDLDLGIPSIIKSIQDKEGHLYFNLIILTKHI